MCTIYIYQRAELYLQKNKGKIEEVKNIVAKTKKRREWETV